MHYEIQAIHVLAKGVEFVTQLDVSPDMTYEGVHGVFRSNIERKVSNMGAGLGKVLKHGQVEFLFHGGLQKTFGPSLGLKLMGDA